MYTSNFFNLGATCGWVFSVAFGSLYPLERLVTKCIGWVGSRDRLDGGGKSRLPLVFDPETATIPVQSKDRVAMCEDRKQLSV